MEIDQILGSLVLVIQIGHLKNIIGDDREYSIWQPFKLNYKSTLYAKIDHSATFFAHCCKANYEMQNLIKKSNGYLR